MDRYLTPPEIARQLRIKPGKVLGWIRSGKLRAINVSDAQRPRFRVGEEDLEDFLKSREVQPPPPHTRRYRSSPKGGPLDEVEGKRLAKSGKVKLVGGTYYRVHDGVILFV